MFEDVVTTISEEQSYAHEGNFTAAFTRVF